MTQGDPTIKIAIIDDSIEKGHPNLAPNFVKGLYLKPDGGTDDDPSPRSGDQRHGTCCAGVAVAAMNGAGACGIAPKCGLIGVNFWDANSPSQLTEGFYFCAANGASIISCSWSWNFAFDNINLAIKDLYRSGREGKGMVVLFAAANDYGPVATTQKFGTLKEVICVGATNWQDEHAAYSNFGPEVCVVAPSSDYYDTPNSLGILTTDNSEAMPKYQGQNYSGYVKGNFTPGTYDPNAFGGTSSATPLVAGVCGLMLSINPQLTAKEVRQILQDTAEKVPGGMRQPANYNIDGQDPYYGYGRVNASKAVKAAKGKKS